jgi:hypothetical protein
MAIASYPRVTVQGSGIGQNVQNGQALMLYNAITGKYEAATSATFGGGGGLPPNAATASNQTTQIAAAVELNAQILSTEGGANPVLVDANTGYSVFKEQDNASAFIDSYGGSVLKKADSSSVFKDDMNNGVFSTAYGFNGVFKDDTGASAFVDRNTGYSVFQESNGDSIFLDPSKPRSVFKSPGGISVFTDTTGESVFIGPNGNSVFTTSNDTGNALSVNTPTGTIAYAKPSHQVVFFRNVGAAGEGIALPDYCYKITFLDNSSISALYGFDGVTNILSDYLNSDSANTAPKGAEFGYLGGNYFTQLVVQDSALGCSFVAHCYSAY